MKFDRGVLAVCNGAAREHGLLDGVKFVAAMFEQLLRSDFDMCPRRQC